jgi:hypothetical protein
MMSDPRYRDPRMDAPLDPDGPSTTPLEARRSGSMWGWIAGGILVALVLMFIFARAPSTSDTASNSMNAPQPGQSTLAPTPAPAPTNQATGSSTAPSTTGQGGTQQ